MKEVLESVYKQPKKTLLYVKSLVGRTCAQWVVFIQKT